MVEVCIWINRVMLLVSKKKADCAYIRHTMKLLSFYGICEIGNKVFVQVFQ